MLYVLTMAVSIDGGVGGGGGNFVSRKSENSFLITFLITNVIINQTLRKKITLNLDKFVLIVRQVY